MAIASRQPGAVPDIFSIMLYDSMLNSNDINTLLFIALDHTELAVLVNKLLIKH